MNYLEKTVSYKNNTVKVKDIVSDIQRWDTICSTQLTVEDCVNIVSHINQVYNKKFKMSVYGTPTILAFL